MSTLGTAVQARVRTQLLIEMTQVDSVTATSVDTTKLELACTDISAEFSTYAMETFDATNARHLTLGVSGVVALLGVWKSQDQDEKPMDSWRKRVESFAKTSSRARVTPLCDKTLGATEETDADGNPMRPLFDWTRTTRDALRPPAARETDE